MAEKKEPIKRTVVSASTGKKQTVEEAKTKNATTKEAPAPLSTKEERSKGAGGKRILAFVFWFLGIGCEVLAVLMLNGTLYLPGMPERKMMYLIIALVVDMIFVIIGSQMWKKANDIDPASEANKLKFFLWNNMGVIFSVIAFLPIIILFLTNKDLDAKTKRIVSVVAVIALLITGVSSIDYNPTSQEELEATQAAAVTSGLGTVYWTPFGRCYHVDPDCQSLQRSATIYSGSIEEAFNANRNTPCSFCAQDFADKIGTADVSAVADDSTVDESTVDGELADESTADESEAA